MRLRTLVVVLGVAVGVAACGIKGPPRPPAPPPPPNSETQPPPAETQPPASQPRGPLPSSIPPPDAGTP
ncbi:MAG TPA: lipoprotein [Archangium sp.]|jgi:multidrug efflux pump subunit AcrA (membrane-fusion protein)|uniref:LPS translocon maturation chaperone LptM n=1 Tax=Archangium sp. TaxID=1872627 RepID=UPI002EDB139E